MLKLVTIIVNFCALKMVFALLLAKIYVAAEEIFDAAEEILVLLEYLNS